MRFIEKVRKLFEEATNHNTMMPFNDSDIRYIRDIFGDIDINSIEAISFKEKDSHLDDAMGPITIIVNGKAIESDHWRSKLTALELAEMLGLELEL